MTVYATAMELADYLGSPAPSGAERLLRRASALLDAHVLTPYAVTYPGGVRTVSDPDVAAALRDAACAQVEWWLETGDEKEATARFASPSVAGISLASSGIRIAPRAIDHLRVGGLHVSGPVSAR